MRTASGAGEPLRAAIYARVSTSYEQTIQEQVRRLRRGGTGRLLRMESYQRPITYFFGAGSPAPVRAREVWVDGVFLLRNGAPLDISNSKARSQVHD